MKVVRELLRSRPRGETAAATVAAPVSASDAEDEEDFTEAATDQVLCINSSVQRKNQDPSRTALDISGHRFAKNLQVRGGVLKE